MRGRQARRTITDKPWAAPDYGCRQNMQSFESLGAAAGLPCTTNLYRAERFHHRRNKVECLLGKHSMPPTRSIFWNIYQWPRWCSPEGSEGRFARQRRSQRSIASARVEPDLQCSHALRIRPKCRSESRGVFSAAVLVHVISTVLGCHIILTPLQAGGSCDPVGVRTANRRGRCLRSEDRVAQRTNNK